MNVSIHFPAEIETILRRHAAAAGKDIETFVQEVVAERLAEESSHEALSHDEFMLRLRQVVSMHPKSNGTLDDSRDSIYAGRGE